MDTNILLESGTNELELLIFDVSGNYYGINVAKVREIINSEPVTMIPNSHPCVEGVFIPRDAIITAINLAQVLGLPNSEDAERDMFIITNFNKLNVSFRVHKIYGINRFSWSDIIVPDKTVGSQDAALATGIVKWNDHLVVILDFEKIVSDISPETGLKVSDIEYLEGRSRNEEPIMIAEDSALLMRLITDCLEKAGYTNIQKNVNGKEAWDKLNEYKKDGTVDEKVHCIITDIEMPQMDGHRLLKLVRDDAVLKDIPVIIFSSLLNDDMRRKGESLGANAQLSKPEIGNLVMELDKILRS